MDWWVWLLIIVAVLIFWGYMSNRAEEKKVAAMPEEERTAYLQRQAEFRRNAAALAAFGQLNPMMICPHCQTQGSVRTKPVTQKKGISGGKATAAVLTGGISVLATGLSRKENLTQAHCDTCSSTWCF